MNCKNLQYVYFPTLITTFNCCSTPNSITKVSPTMDKSMFGVQQQINKMMGKFTYKHTTKHCSFSCHVNCIRISNYIVGLVLAYKYHSQPLEQLEYSKLQTVKQLLYSSLSLNIPPSSQHDWLYDYQKIRLFPGSETILPCSEALLSSSLSHSCTEDEVEYTISPKTKAKKRPGNEISLTVMSLHITHGI